MEKMIEEEIKRHGNTNFITNSGFSSGQQIFVVGDSHCIFFHNSLKIKEHWFFGCHLPLTIYGLIHTDIDPHKIGQILGNGHELYEIKENDFVVFFFGFNDIQRNINLHASHRWTEEIKFLTDEYVKCVKNLKEKYGILPIIPCIYPNPREGAIGQNPKGTFGERQMYTLFANEQLKNKCQKEKIPFLDIYDFIADKDGFIKDQITVDKIHLDYNNRGIQNFVENKIIELCENYPK